MNFKKIVSTVALTATIAASTMGTTLAAPVRPSDGDTARINITGFVESDATTCTATAYRVVGARYNEYGFVEYVRMPGITAADIADMVNPTADEVNAIARDILATNNGKNLETVQLTLQTAGASTFATGDIEAGSYIVLVSTATGEYVFNPIYVSACYTDANDESSLVQTSSIDLTTATFGTAYAKKSYTSLDKDIVNASTGNTETEDVAIGDTVNFKITTNVPDYSDFHVSPVFKITDTYCEGLNSPTNIVVKSNNVAITENKDYTVVKDDASRNFVITFTDAFLKVNPLSAIEVTYSAVVNTSAKIGDFNDNNARLTYTTTPTFTHDYDDTVNVYSYEFIAEKVDADDHSVKLAGAEFSLVRADGKTYTATSDAKGVVKMSGLDVGTYTLRETYAPVGYAINPEVYTVVISATYDADADGVGALIDANRTAYANEKMINWTVTVTDSQGTQVSTATFTATSLSHDSGADIPDTALITLPSTGGMGTLAFSIGGAIVVFAGVIALFGKKKEVEE